MLSKCVSSSGQSSAGFTERAPATETRKCLAPSSGLRVLDGFGGVGQNRLHIKKPSGNQYLLSFAVVAFRGDPSVIHQVLYDPATEAIAFADFSWPGLLLLVVATRV